MIDYEWKVPLSEEDALVLGVGGNLAGTLDEPVDLLLFQS